VLVVASSGKSLPRRDKPDGGSIKVALSN
jgi:hypothetical protein